MIFMKTSIYTKVITHNFCRWCIFTLANNVYIMIEDQIDIIKVVL